MQAPRLGRRTWLLLASGLLTVAALALALYDLSLVRSAQARNTPESSQSRSLGLRAERTDGVLKLTWNPLIEALRTADHVDLRIDDGDHQSRLRLTPGQVHGGTLAYSPSTDNVVFHLEALDRNHHAASETLQVVQSRTPREPQPGDAPQQLAIEVNSPQRGTADRSPRTARAISARQVSDRMPGTLIVRGTLLRDTPVDVRIPVDRYGRPTGASSETASRHSGGVFHRLTGWGKKTARLWPFHGKDQSDQSR